MKLILGDKIRNLRKAANMTQEQLADRLGMSCQAVSRRENGTAYPDLELLTPLAEIFGVTSDFLLGIPEEKKEQEAKKLFTELVEATYAKEVDTEKVIRLIREIRLNHLKSRHFQTHSKITLPEYIEHPILYSERAYIILKAARIYTHAQKHLPPLSVRSLPPRPQTAPHLSHSLPYRLPDRGRHLPHPLAHLHVPAECLR